MDSIGIQAKQLYNLLEPIAAMMVKRIHPVEDEVSMNAAYREYGRTWVEEQRLIGNITPRRKGKRLVLSRAELDTLRVVSDQTPKVIIRSNPRRRAGQK